MLTTTNRRSGLEERLLANDTNNIEPEQPTLVALREEDKIEIRKANRVLIGTDLPPWTNEKLGCGCCGCSVLRNTIYLEKDFVRIQRKKPICRCLCLACCDIKENSDVFLHNVTAISRVSAHAIHSKRWSWCQILCSPLGCHRSLVNDNLGLLSFLVFTLCLTYYSVGGYLIAYINCWTFYQYGCWFIFQFDFSNFYITTAIILTLAILDVCIVFNELGLYTLHIAVSGSLKECFYLNMGDEKRTQGIMNWIFTFQGMFRERNTTNVIIQTPDDIV